MRAGGRIPLIIGRGLTDQRIHVLGLPASDVFMRPQDIFNHGKGYTLAQRWSVKPVAHLASRQANTREPR